MKKKEKIINKSFKHTLNAEQDINVFESLEISQIKK